MNGRSTDTNGGRDAATVFATPAGAIAFGLLIQSLLAHVLLPEGRGVYAVSICILRGPVRLVHAGLQYGCAVPGHGKETHRFLRDDRGGDHRFGRIRLGNTESVPRSSLSQGYANVLERLVASAPDRSPLSVVDGFDHFSYPLWNTPIVMVNGLPK